MAGRGSAISRKRKTGVQWYAVYDGPRHADGSRNQIWEPATPNNRATARKLATRRLAQIHSGEWEHPHHPVSFRDLAKKWLDLNVRPRAASNTLDAYLTWLNSHVLPYFGKADARSLRSEDLQAFVALKLDAGLAVGYVRQLVGQVKTILRQGIEWGQLRPGAADFRVRYPRVQKEEVDPFTPEEIRALLMAAKPRWRPWLTMAIWTGMRQAELIAARWRNLDATKAEYFVRESMTRRMKFGNVKGANAAPVDISPIVLRALEEQKAMVAEWRLVAIEWEDHNLLFPNATTGRPWTHSYLRKVFIATCEAAGVRYRPPHHLRHTCASLILYQGDSIKVVQMQLRHANPQITLTTYIHLMPNERRRAVEQLDETIMGANTQLTDRDQQGQ
ncbi:MAG: site-specific integrase [Candidatus Latescibacterota bacterium]